jgi:hypothetical protein
MAQRNDAMRESVKGLILINGGGAAALFALLQAVMDDRRVFATFILAGISCLLFGLACAGIVQFLRFRAPEKHQQGDKPGHRRYYRRYTGLTIASLVAFVTGAGIVVVGALVQIWGCV